MRTATIRSRKTLQTGLTGRRQTRQAGVRTIAWSSSSTHERSVRPGTADLGQGRELPPPRLPDLGREPRSLDNSWSEDYRFLDRQSANRTRVCISGDCCDPGDDRKSDLGAYLKERLRLAVPRGARRPLRSTASSRTSTHTYHSSGPHCPTMIAGSHGHCSRSPYSSCSECG